MWNFEQFIYIATQPLLADADVTRAHYLCSMLHKLSEDPWGSPPPGSVGDAPWFGKPVLFVLQK